MAPYMLFEYQNGLALTDTKYNITLNEHIPFWGLHGLAIWMMFVNEYMIFWTSKKIIELTDTKGHIAFNEPIPYWGLHGPAIWMIFVNDYMLFWMSKTTLSWLIQKVILLSMNLSHIEDSMAYLYEWCLYMIICFFEYQK